MTVFPVTMLLLLPESACAASRSAVSSPIAASTVPTPAKSFRRAHGYGPPTKVSQRVRKPARRLIEEM